jgi:hypothetical protein
MDNFPFTLAFFLGFFAVAALCMVAFGLGKEDLRGRYHQCIMLGAPQENCIKTFLGDK